MISAERKSEVSAAALYMYMYMAINGMPSTSVLAEI